MLGVADTRPTQVEDMIMPVPTPSAASRSSRSACSSRAATRSSPGAARCSTGPSCRCSPTSTGATSTCCCSTCRRHRRHRDLARPAPAVAEVLVVTTPQEAASEVAERAGTMASMMHQRVIGVDREHELPRLPALRARAQDRGLRLRRRRPGRGHALAPLRVRRAGARPDPARAVAARGRRRRQADRRVRPHRPGRPGARQDRGRSGRARTRSGRHAAGLTPTSKF